jgi:hypothetical protein
LEVVLMAVGVRRALTLAALLAFAAVLAPLGSAGTRSSHASSLPTLYVQYTMNCTFSIVDDNGRPVTTIAPGNYQLEVSTPVMFKLVRPGGVTSDEIAPNDFTGCKGWVQFQLTGPGVNVFTTLDSGCDAYLIIPEQTFKPSSTYTATDLNQPSVAHATFSTAASGTPTAPTKSAYGTTSGKGTSQQDIVGSLQRSAVKGTLTGGLSATGKPSLTTKGKQVSVLKTGRYNFAIKDLDKKGSFTLEAVSGGTVKDLTSVPFVGRHSVTLNLTPGRWMYYAVRGKAYYFLVTN